MKIKPNNSWEIEKLNLVKEISKAMSYDYSEYDAMSNNDTPEEVAVNLLDDFITKTLQQQREELLDNKKVEEIMMKIFKERKAELDVIKFKSNTRAFAVAGIDLIYNYMLEVIKLLQSLKQDNK